MKDGIITRNSEEEDLAEFIINDAYPYNVIPLICIATGPKIYQLGENESNEYLGIHLMDTWECLEHPKYRETPLIFRKQFNRDKLLVEGVKSPYISFDSFELWKFTELLLKGSFVIYELLYMPPIHYDPGADELLELCRLGLTNKIGKYSKAKAYHEWRKKKFCRIKTAETYFRLMQSIFFLREEEYIWNTDLLVEYITPEPMISKGSEILLDKEKYRKKVKLQKNEINVIEQEIAWLVEEVDKAMIVTKFPDQFSAKIFKDILKIIKEARVRLI